MEGGGKTILLASIILALGLVVATTIGAFAFYKVRSFEDSLSVTGSAKQEIVSDTVRWSAQFVRQTTIANLKVAYAQMAQDEKAVKEFLISRGIGESETTIAPVSLEEIFDYRPEFSQGEKKYTLRVHVSVNSKNVDSVTATAKNIETLLAKGIVFSTNQLEYFYSGLPELRVALLADAIKDAKARAQRIAEASGKSVGQLKSASSGVVQVLPLNSVDVNDYGAYATSDVKKEVMVTVKAAFTLR